MLNVPGAMTACAGSFSKSPTVYLTLFSVGEGENGEKEE